MRHLDKFRKNRIVWVAFQAGTNNYPLVFNNKEAAQAWVTGVANSNELGWVVLKRELHKAASG